jgi:hypothetical protein
VKNYFRPERLWPVGRRLLHVYYLPVLSPLAPLLDAYAPILAAEPALAPVPRAWLHATVLKIGIPADRISPADQAMRGRLDEREQVSRLGGGGAQTGEHGDGSGVASGGGEHRRQDRELSMQPVQHAGVVGGLLCVHLAPFPPFSDRAMTAARWSTGRRRPRGLVTRSSRVTGKLH